MKYNIIYNIDVFTKCCIVYVIYILPFSEFCGLCHLSTRRWKANPFVSSSIYIKVTCIVEFENLLREVNEYP